MWFKISTGLRERCIYDAENNVAMWRRKETMYKQNYNRLRSYIAVKFQETRIEINDFTKSLKLNPILDFL